MSLPESKKGEMVSFVQNINYIVTCNGTEYHGIITLDSSYGIRNSEDGNPYYDIELINIRNNLPIVMIRKK